MPPIFTHAVEVRYVDSCGSGEHVEEAGTLYSFTTCRPCA